MEDGPWQWLRGLSAVDLALLAVLLLSVVTGVVRGFVFECLSLAGWVVAWFAAQWAAPHLAPLLQDLVRGESLRFAAALAIGFVVALVAWGLLARLVRLLLHATPLSVPDRLLGGVFGALRGVVLLLAVATVVALTPAAQSQGWRKSRGAQALGDTLQVLKPLLPTAVAQLLPAANPAPKTQR